MKKNFDAYADIAWETPSFSIDSTDERWAYHNVTDDPLVETDWYATLDSETRSALGLHVMANFAKIGIGFESILQRGLIAYAAELPNGAPEFRYAYHEIVEEGQHSLMFQEFVNRSRVDAAGLPGWFRHGARAVIELATRFPELFFMYVLGGEEPIDYVQRRSLREKERLPPLLRRISEIHVTEEARHISFARTYLRERVPSLPAHRKLALALTTPALLGQMTPLMIRPSEATVRRFAIPEEAWSDAYDDNPDYSARLTAATDKIRVLCAELDLVPRAARILWKRFGMWPAADC